MRVVVHKFKGMSDLGFDPEAYSKFKYGSSWEAFAFGIELGRELSKWVKDHCNMGDHVMISGAPFNKIPVASTALAKFACMYLQINWKDITFETFKIDRAHSYDVDYGKMSAEQREALISKDVFKTDVNYLQGKHVVFIDDIIITGAHEKNMEKMVAEMGLKSLTPPVYAYYAALEDSKCCPSIEADLNYAFIQEGGGNFASFVETAKLTQNNLELNTRAVKFILALPEEELLKVVSVMEGKTKRDLIAYTYANGYNVNSKYKDNCRLLRNTLINE